MRQFERAHFPVGHVAVVAVAAMVVVVAKAIVSDGWAGVLEEASC
jgi:hypothetical protein